VQTYRQHVSNDNIPEQKVPLLRKGPVKNGGNLGIPLVCEQRQPSAAVSAAYLLGADQVPVQKTRLQASRSSDLIFGRSLDSSHPQRTDCIGKQILGNQLQSRPLQQVNAIDILDDSAVLEELVDSRNGRILGVGVI
jgi:hypothetical protein